MNGFDTFRTMFMFSPPDDQVTGWSLTFEDFANALRSREPEAPTARWSGAFSGETLSFVFTTSAGDKAEGMAGADPVGVSIDGCTCAEAAEFAHWLRSAVPPPGQLVQVNMTEGVEWELPPVELPLAETETLQEVLMNRLREIIDHEEQQLV